MLLSIAIQHYLTAMTGVMAPGTIDFYAKRLPSLVTQLGDPEVTSITLDQLRQYRAALASRPTRWGGGITAPGNSGRDLPALPAPVC